MSNQSEIITAILELAAEWGYAWSRQEVEEFVRAHTPELQEK